MRGKRRVVDKRGETRREREVSIERKNSGER